MALPKETKNIPDSDEREFIAMKKRPKIVRNIAAGLFVLSLAGAGLSIKGFNDTQASMDEVGREITKVYPHPSGKQVSDATNTLRDIFVEERDAIQHPYESNNYTKIATLVADPRIQPALAVLKSESIYENVKQKASQDNGLNFWEKLQTVGLLASSMTIIVSGLATGVATLVIRETDKLLVEHRAMKEWIKANPVPKGDPIIPL